MTRFATVLLLAGLFSTPALADGMSRPGDDDSASSDRDGRGGRRNNDRSPVQIAQVTDLLRSFGLSVPAIESLLDGLSMADIQRLARDLQGGNLPGISGGDLGEIFGLGGDDRDGRKGGKKGKKGKKGRR